MIQQHVPRSIHGRGGRFHTLLDQGEQLDQCPFWSSGSDPQEDPARQGNSVSGCSSVERHPLDANVAGHERMTANPVAPYPGSVLQSSWSPRASAQPTMGTVCMESLWKSRLKALGWPEGPASLVQYSLSSTTWSTYNKVISDFAKFAEECQQALSEVTESTLAAFVEHITRRCE